MKAAVRKKYGPPSAIKIEELATPTPGEDEILVKVFATTVNRTDCANLTAKPFIMRFVLGFSKPRIPILGTDFAGEVTAIGKNVQTFKISDRVFGFFDTGLSSQAEYLVIKPHGNVLKIPEGLDYKHAVASLEGAHYAYTFIKKSHLQSGQKVLINGSTGAIGSALLQFVKQFDVEISATCNTKNIELIRSLGATKIFDYTKEDFTKSTEKFDFVFDAVGKSTFGKCRPILKKGGVYISSELGPFAQNIFYSLMPKLAGNKKVFFPVPYKPSETLPFIKNHLEAGLFTSVIDREYPLDEISNAYNYVLTGQKTGNVVINI